MQERYPNKLQEFIGQEEIVETLLIAILASLKSGNCLQHILFAGPGGLGKTTLSECVARTSGKEIYYCTGGSIKSASDIERIIDWLEERTHPILFIDEIHMLPSKIEEMFYPVLQDFMFEGRQLQKFTVIGGTTNHGDLKKPFRDRFKYLFRLKQYSVEELRQMIEHLSPLVDSESALALAKISHGIPRIAKNYLVKCEDHATAFDEELITVKTVSTIMDRHGVDKEGLCEEERSILKFLFESGCPVGLEVLELTLDIDRTNIKHVYERVLLQKGYIARARGGRVLTALGVDYLMRNNLVSH